MDAGTLELVELDTQLDFEHTPTCCWTPCPADATWLEVNECCGADWYFCGPCKNRVMAYISGPGAFICNNCNARNSPFRWEPIR